MTTFASVLVASTILTEQDFSQRFNVSKRTAQRWRVTGDGPPFVRIGKRRVGYRLSDCEVWEAQRTFRHRADEIAAGIDSQASAA